MRVEVIRPHCLGSGVDAYAGDIVEIADRDVSWKLQQGWVKPAPVPAPAAPAELEPAASTATGEDEPQGDETAEGVDQNGAPVERPGRRRRN